MRGPLAPALLGVAVGLALIAVVSLVTRPAADAQQQEQSAAVELLSLPDAEKADPQFAGCVSELKGAGMDLVMQVDNACGDVFTASDCSVACHAAAMDLADTMGCCWRPLISGFSRVEPAAAHAWHAWSFSLENLCGVSLSGTCQAQTYSAQKDVANKALGAAQAMLDKANTQAAAAQDAQRRALKAQAQAKKLQKEMKKEEAMFTTLRKHFRESRADAARSVIVERMVHNSVKKDLQSAWGIHQQVAHDRRLAAGMAAGTQVQQANAEKLLKSAHAAKRAVYNMAKMATKAKKAAFRLHKLALTDMRLSAKVQRRAALQRQIAEKASRDVKRQLKQSEAIIEASKAQQGKAKKLWGALKKEQADFDAEDKDAKEGAADEDALDKKMAGEIAAAEDKFDDFEKDEDAAEEAVAHAQELASKAADISEDSENLLKATQQQQDHIDEERGWLTQQEASMMAGRQGIAAMEGELDGLRAKYLALQRAIAGLDYATPDITPVHNPHHTHRHVHADTYVDEASPFPLPHHTHYEQHVDADEDEQQPGGIQYVIAQQPPSQFGDDSNNSEVFVVPYPPRFRS